MTTKRFTLFAIILAAFVLFMGCKKEETDRVLNEPQSSVSGMLHFGSAEEFLEAQQKVHSMSETERREWERQQGFKSYATYCYELLEELETEGIHSEKDVYRFVNDNPEYFIIHEEKGEKYLLNRLDNSMYKYYVNKYQMIQIGYTIMKVFEEGIVYGTIEQIEEIQAVKWFEKSDNTSLLFIPFERKNMFLDSEENNREVIDSIWKDAGTYTNISYISQRITTGFIANANRNVTKVYCERYLYSTSQIGEVTIYHFHWRIIGSIRPWHRIAGIWFPCQRTKTYNIHTKWLYDGLSSEGSDHSYNYDGVGGYEVQFINKDFANELTNFHFTQFSGWSLTPDTPMIVFPLASE